ncbi:hypothetical protein D0C36_04055 [Mucilaginibacter conchicola]|uniref:Uncharacterized protein n=1 Tax=Mucilaginibacter conchicola TaxID=2303333 RepID=A0A372NXX2_9SPHI|nr:hypothetical protein [Mucilaginibacter conchicola]RFZ94721.1 hypothetical protein D0C36_04055 [Mucilaginibacter conchicola]
MRYRFYLVLFFALSHLKVSAQETTKVTRKLTNTITENFLVLNNGNTRHGMYQALYKKKIAIASGAYNNGKRVGLWQFYNNRGTVVQSYNFDKQQFVFEAPEDSTSNIHYFIDRTFDTIQVANAKADKPLRIGGCYYGYMPYVSLFRIPKRYTRADYDFSKIKVVVELLVSQGGRLADYTVHLVYQPTNELMEDIRMNLKLPNPDDLIFTPATYNGEPVACRIMIECTLNDNGTIDFLK